MLKEEDLRIYVNMLKEGAKPENNKLDFKAKWWDMSHYVNLNSESLNEFLKDLTAMANTPGDTGYIIVGLDEETGSIKPAHIPLDQSKLQGIICRRVEEPFDFTVYEVPVDGQNLSVIEIPPSLRKPHVIKEYRSKKGFHNFNYIPIRKNTTTHVANKYDLDFMYFEKNTRTIVDYGLDIKVQEIVQVIPNFGTDGGKGVKIEIPVILINKGINVNCIQDGNLIIEESEENLMIGLTFDITGFRIDNNYQSLKDWDVLTIESNKIIRTFFVFALNTESYSAFESDSDFKLRIEIEDIRDNKYTSNLFKLIIK